MLHTILSFVVGSVVLTLVVALILGLFYLVTERPFALFVLFLLCIAYKVGDIVLNLFQGGIS